MDSDRVWSRDLRIEEKGRSGGVTRKVFKVDIRSGKMYTPPLRLFSEEGIAARKVKNENRTKSLEF